MNAAETKRTTFVEEELEALFKYIPSPQLLELRTVSTEWDKVAQHALRKRRLKLFLRIGEFVNHPSKTRTILKFLNFLNNSPQAFVAPVIDISAPYKDNPSCLPTIEEICKILGNREGPVTGRTLIIQKPLLAYTYPYTLDFILTVIRNLSKSLETLEICVSMYDEDDTSIAIEFQLPLLKELKLPFAFQNSKFLKTIFVSSPNLMSISGGGLCHDFIPLLSETGHLSKLKNIYLRKPEELELLLKCQPKIVLRKMGVARALLDPMELNKFLEEQRLSLKNRNFDYEDQPLLLQLSLPSLPVLVKLSISPSCSGHCLPAINYGRDTPALKYLKIDSGKTFQDFQDLISYPVTDTTLPCSSLEELHLGLRGQSNQYMFDNLEMLFPNLKSVGFDMDNPGELEIEWICKSWPNLEKLFLSLYAQGGIFDLDEIVFGMQEDWKREIDTKENEWWTKIPPPETQRVGNLKNLRRLEIKVTGKLSDPIYKKPSHTCVGMSWRTRPVGNNLPDPVVRNMSNFFIYFGLKLLPNLEEFLIKGINTRDMFSNALDFLTEKLPKLKTLDVEDRRLHKNKK